MKRIGQLIREWGPYAMLWLTIMLALYSPTWAMFILAILHFSALEKIRKPALPKLYIDLVAHAILVEINIKKYRAFAGRGGQVTCSQKYTIGEHEYEVKMTRVDEKEEIAA